MGTQNENPMPKTPFQGKKLIFFNIKIITSIGFNSLRRNSSNLKYVWYFQTILNLNNNKKQKFNILLINFSYVFIFFKKKVMYTQTELIILCK